MTQAAQFAPNEALAQHLIPHVCGPGDTAHDLSHILRVWQNVLLIAATEGGDLRILTAATLLHDCVYVPKDSPHRAQASRLAADKARDILTDLNWTQSDIIKTTHTIEAHSFSANITPTSVAAKILQDADRLDAIGHIGIARCFAVSGQLGRALYDPDDPSATDRPLDDSTFALDHFHTKLLKLSTAFQTETGRKMAANRHKTMQNFVTGLLTELGLPGISPNL